MISDQCSVCGEKIKSTDKCIRIVIEHVMESNIDPSERSCVDDWESVSCMHVGCVSMFRWNQSSFFESLDYMEVDKCVEENPKKKPILSVVK